MGAFWLLFHLIYDDNYISPSIYLFNYGDYMNHHQQDVLK